MKVRTVLLLLAGAALVYGLARRDAYLSRQTQTWKDAAQRAIRDGERHRAVRDSLIVEENRLSARLQALSGDLRRLGRAADSLSRVAGTSQSVEPYRRALLASQNLGAACRVTLAVTDSGWTTCRERASLAEKIGRAHV